jgi:hypothetical protein
VIVCRINSKEPYLSYVRERSDNCHRLDCRPCQSDVHSMIFLFITYNLLWYGNVLAAALPSLHPTSDISLYPREIDTNRFTHRSTWNIILSCFATLFACSWVAIHPNIPAKSDSSIRRFFRHLMIMAYMLVVPEAVIYWAARQWWAARNIAKKHRGV